MPYGLKKLPETFVRLMEQVIRGLLFKEVVYLNDIIDYADIPKEHLRRLLPSLRDWKMKQDEAIQVFPDAETSQILFKILV